jgi:competence protein ComEC
MGKIWKWGGLIMILLVAGVWLRWPDGRVHVVMCDVGQGDASLITKGFTQVLIDGGPSQEKLLACLSERMPFWDRQIEMVVLSNNDGDHYTGLISVFERYEVGLLVASSIVKEAKSFWAFRQAVVDEGTKVHVPKVGEELKAGELEFRVLWPEERMGEVAFWQDTRMARLPDGQGLVNGESVLGAVSTDEPNSYSVVLDLKYGEFKGLFTGDIGVDEEEALVDSGLIRDVEFLKVAHHGSKYSSSLEFLEVAKPEVAVIGVGAKNSYGHPTSETLGRLEEVGAKVWRTDKDGEIEIITDGQRMWQKN